MLVKDQPERFIQRDDGTYYEINNPDTCIDGTVYVSPNVMIKGRAVIRDEVILLDHAVVRDDVLLTDKTTIEGYGGAYGCARIMEDAIISCGGSVQDNAIARGSVRVTGLVRGHAIVGGDAVIKGYAEGLSYVVGGTLVGEAIAIGGLSYPIQLIAPGEVRIGCKTYTIAEWLAPMEESIIPWRDYCSETEIEMYQSLIRGIQLAGQSRKIWEQM